jgi:hypothetical protein
MENTCRSTGEGKRGLVAGSLATQTHTTGEAGTVRLVTPTRHYEVWITGATARRRRKTMINCIIWAPVRDSRAGEYVDASDASSISAWVAQRRANETDKREPIVAKARPVLRIGKFQLTEL